jgi:hypothetical protein
MQKCEEHKALAKDIGHIKEAVTRIDHGLNGVDGSIGLVDRVKKIEGVIDKNTPIWSKMRGLGSNLTIIVRTLIVAILMALGSVLGGYLWVILTGVRA